MIWQNITFLFASHEDCILILCIFRFQNIFRSRKCCFFLSFSKYHIPYLANTLQHQEIFKIQKAMRVNTEQAFQFTGNSLRRTKNPSRTSYHNFFIHRSDNEHGRTCTSPYAFRLYGEIIYVCKRKH